MHECLCYRCTILFHVNDAACAVYICENVREFIGVADVVTVPATVTFTASNVYRDILVGKISFYSIDALHTLVRVCRKWRIVVFGLPRRLNL